ncbi:hypothetical protein SAMN05216276_10971, partial [Streptosporangium subroseum]
ASITGPIWKDTMLAALKNVPPTSFTPINSERFGGCGESCRPAPPPMDGDDTQEVGPEDEDGDGGSRG